MFGWLTVTLRDHNSDLQVIAFGHSVLIRTCATFQVGDLVHGQVASPLLFLISVLRIVVLWGNDTSGLTVRKVRDDVAPSNIVIDAQGDDEDLAHVGQETKGATCTA